MKTADRKRNGKAANAGFTFTPPNTRHSPPSHSKSHGKISSTSSAAAGHLLGKLVGFSESNAPLVDFSGNPSSPSGIVARSTIPLDQSHVGSEVVLLFAGAGLTNPIVMGRILSSAAVDANPAAKPLDLDVELNGQRLELTAQTELVLRCGNASITLTKAGKVLIRGAYLLSRSSGVNRIKGGSVQIN